MRISDWSSDVCSSDLRALGSRGAVVDFIGAQVETRDSALGNDLGKAASHVVGVLQLAPQAFRLGMGEGVAVWMQRSEEHTSELQSLMRISYAVFCLKKKKFPYSPRQ